MTEYAVTIDGPDFANWLDGFASDEFDTREDAFDVFTHDECMELGGEYFMPSDFQMGHDIDPRATAADHYNDIAKGN